MKDKISLLILGIWWGLLLAGILLANGTVSLLDIAKTIAYIGVIIFMGIETYIELKSPNKL